MNKFRIFFLSYYDKSGHKAFHPLMCKQFSKYDDTHEDSFLWTFIVLGLKIVFRDMNIYFVMRFDFLYPAQLGKKYMKISLIVATMFVMQSIWMYQESACTLYVPQSLIWFCSPIFNTIFSHLWNWLFCQAQTKS